MDYNKWIGLSGWGLSLILGFLKIRESYFDRFRIHILSSFNSFTKCNTITIASKKTITIVYYELFFATNKLNVKSQEYIETGTEVDGCNIKIPSDSSYDLKFDGQYYFDLGSKRFQKKKLYISLNIIGRRKPLIKLVYNPKNK